MESYGILRNPMEKPLESYGMLWNPMESYGSIWKPMESYRITGIPMESYELFCLPMSPYGLQRPLIIAIDISTKNVALQSRIIPA